jgi:hypothetical protein
METKLLMTATTEMSTPARYIIGFIITIAIMGYLTHLFI